MAEWLRPGLWEVLTIKLRGIEPGQVLITKKPTGRVVPKSRPLVTVAGVSQMLFGDSMAEWLRPGWGFGRYSRLSCVGSNLVKF